VSPMNSIRRFHSAKLLPNGKVLVAGGQQEGLNPLNSAELFDPVTGKWTLTGSMGTAHVGQITELLPTGNVLVAGGQDTNFAALTASEVYDVGLGYAASSRPQLAAPAAPINLGSRLALTGAKLRGVGEGSGGNSSQDSP